MEKTAEQLRREHIALEGDTHGKNKWAILFTVLVMTFMACLDASIVTVALPVMQKELGVGLDRIQLVSSVYLLATCVAMLPFGRLGDVRGKVPAWCNRLYGWLVALRAFGFARGAYLGAFRAGHWLCRRDGQQYGHHHRVVSGA